MDKKMGKKSMEIVKKFEDRIQQELKQDLKKVNKYNDLGIVMRFLERCLVDKYTSKWNWFVFDYLVSERLSEECIDNLAYYGATLLPQKIIDGGIEEYLGESFTVIKELKEILKKVGEL